MESHLLEILVCPLCKGPLQYDRAGQELTCKADKLAFPVRDGIPVMLESEARALAGTADSTGASSEGAKHGPDVASGQDGDSNASAESSSSAAGRPDAQA